MERLTESKIKSLKESMKSNLNFYFYNDVMKVFDELLEYRHLEEQGMLLKLHFGKGDVVYEIVHGADGERYIIPRKCMTSALLLTLNEKVGKTVFLTKSEAEKVLEEMKEKEK